MRIGGKASLPDLAIRKTAGVENFCLFCCVAVVFRDSGKDRKALPASSATAPVSKVGVLGVMPVAAGARKMSRPYWRRGFRAVVGEKHCETERGAKKRRQ